MKLNQMQAFKEVMLTGSVSQAARNLYRTQPAISSLISGLEDELGMQLFERRDGRLHPVPEAHYLFEECSDMLRRIGTIRQNMERIKARETGELKVASMPGPSVFLLPELIARHGLAHSGIKCTLVSRSSEAIYQLMAAQQYDLGVADYNPSIVEGSGLIETDVFRFRCLCAVSVEDKLAKKRKITPDDLEKRSLATLYPEHPSYERTAEAFLRAGRKMNVTCLAQYFIPLLTFVEMNIACAIVDPITAESYALYRGDDKRVVFKPFEPEVSFDVAIVRPAHRPMSLIASHLSEKLAEQFAEMGEAVS